MSKTPRFTYHTEGDKKTINIGGKEVDVNKLTPLDRFRDSFEDVLDELSDTTSDVREIMEAKDKEVEEKEVGLEIHDDIDVETGPVVDADDLEEFEKQEEEKTIPLIVHDTKNRKREKESEKGLLYTLLVSPFKAIFNFMYTLVFNLVDLLSGIVKFVLVSVIATSILVVLYTTFVDDSVSAAEVVSENYDVVKDVLVVIIGDLVEVFKELFEK